MLQVIVLLFGQSDYPTFGIQYFNFITLTKICILQSALLSFIQKQQSYKHWCRNTQTHTFSWMKLSFLKTKFHQKCCPISLANYPLKVTYGQLAQVTNHLTEITNTLKVQFPFFLSFFSSHKYDHEIKILKRHKNSFYLMIMLVSTKFFSRSKP